MKEEKIKKINGGVCAAQGFLAAGVYCGIRRNRTKKDLALVYTSAPANAAAVYTRNLVKGAPLAVTKAHVDAGKISAVICNSGIANTCCAGGKELAEATCALVGEALGIPASSVAVASTGVIGQPLDLAPFRRGIPELVATLSRDGTPAAQAIMTTDTINKQAAVEFELGGKVCRLGGMAKGSGMIHPNMATMLVYLTTDAAISKEMLQRALSLDIESTFNMMSVDGDTSTNDMVLLLANGMAGNEEITCENDDFRTFMCALNTVNIALCRMLAGDGEGATKLLDCVVTGADTLADARKAAKSVICSSLVKAAMFGADANWGRVLCAMGYGGASFDPEKVSVVFRSAAGEVEVCRGGSGTDFSEEKAKEVLSANEIIIEVSLGGGSFSAEAWGCDLTYDYVRINGDYRT